MKFKSANLFCLASVSVTLSNVVLAAEITRANVAITLNDPTAWVGGIVPGTADSARWDATAAANTNNALGVDTEWGGIKVINPGANVTIPAGNLLTLNGSAGGIDLSSPTTTRDLIITAPLAVNGNQTWNILNGRFLTINGATPFSQGSSDITLNGNGQTSFNFAAAVEPGTGTGSITVNRGTLRLETPNGAAFPTNLDIISPNTTLILGGGTMVQRSGNSIGRYTQNFSNLSIAPGASQVNQERGSGSHSITRYAAITRQVGGTLNLHTTNGGGAGHQFSAGTFPNELISGGLTNDANHFARQNAIGDGATATNLGNATYQNDLWAAGNRTAITVNGAFDNATTAAVRFGNAGAFTVTLTGTNVITSGGLLVAGGVGNNPSTITGGILTGSAAGDLIVHQHNGNVNGSLTIASEIADNAGSSALTKTGGGVLILGGNNTFTNGVYLNQGTVRLGSAGALNSAAPNAITFTNNSNAILQLSGNSVTVSKLETTPVPAVAPPIVENLNATGATLTISNGINHTFAGTIRDGLGGGKLGITKTQAGTLTLSGVSTAYTGDTTISQGTLALTGSAVPGTTNIVAVATGAVLDVSGKTGGSWTVANGQTLTGSGSVTGGVVTSGGSIVSPGSSSIGTLTVGALTVGSGSVFNFEFDATAAPDDQIVVSGTDSLTIAANSGFNLYQEGTTNKLQTNGTFKLFQYSGAIQGAGVASLSPANILNPQGGLFYSFAENGGFVEMTVSGVPAPTSAWVAPGSGSWGDSGNWEGGVIPNLLGATARFNSVGAPSTVTLDGSRSAGALEFNSANSYTIAQGSGGVLSLDNGPGNATIVVASGSHTISAPVTLFSNTAVTVSNALDTLTLSGLVADDGTPRSLTKGGPGTLNLLGSLETGNTFSGGLSVTGGTVEFNSIDSLGTSFITLAGGGLKWSASMADELEDISSRIVTLGSGGGTLDTNGNDVTFAGAIGNAGPGSLTKAGAGVLTLASGSDFTGGVVINAGTVVISADSALGAPPVSPAVRLTFQPGTGNTATLKFAAATTLDTNRSILLTNGTGEFDTSSGDGTFGGLIFGTGRLKKSGTGILTLTGVNDVNATGGTTIDNGTLFVNNVANLPGGGVIMNNDAIISVNAATFHNNYTINGNNTIINRGSNLTSVGGGLTGTGTLTLASPFVNDYIGGSLDTFFGTVRLGGGTRLQGINGNANLTLDTNGNGVGIRSGPYTVAIGALTGATGNLGGSTGSVSATTWNIGGKNTDTIYGGTFSNGDSNAATTVNKIGSGSLTLTGTGNHTGATSINAGTLIFNGGTLVASQTNVALDATLTGVGTLAAVNVLSGGNLAPGLGGIGALSAGNTTIQGNWRVQIDGTAATIDSLAVAGNLNLANGFIDFSILEGTLTASGYIFATYTNLSGASFAQNVPEGYRVDYNYLGSAQIALTTAPATVFETYVENLGLTGGDGLETADFDKDGINNFLEFVLGSDPQTSDTAVLPDQNTADPNTLVFTFTRSDLSQTQAGATLKVEVSNDLEDWAAIPPITVTAGNSSGPGYTVGVQENAGDPDLVTVTIQRNGNTKLFARLAGTY